MKHYETAFVISPTLSDEETEEFIQKMAEVVTQKNGRMVKQDIWGKRKLAYPIKKFQEGVYVFFLYEGEGDVSLELERRFKQSDTVIRFLTVKKDIQDQTRRKKKRDEAPSPPPAEGSSETRPAEIPAAEVTEEN